MGKHKALTKDAGNRGWRTLLVSLTFDILTAVALVLWTTFDKANGWGEIEWTLLSFSLVKSVVVAIGAFVLRRFVDPSRIPTPLPPDPVPEPAE